MSSDAGHELPPDGRVRLRERRRGKTKKGRKRFAPKWREPRLFIIYAVDDEGRMADDFTPVIDGTLESCDQLFALLLAYLRGFKLTEAARVLFVADGAAWIWRRIPRLVKSLGLQEENVQQLIDFWHAMEYLGKIAESKSLKGPRKTHWLKIQKKRLWRGEIGTVVEEIQSLLGPQKTKDQKTWLNYFITHGLTHRRLRSISRTPHADWKWRNRKRRSPSHQPASQKQRCVLATPQRGNHDSTPCLDQSGARRRTLPTNNLHHTGVSNLMTTKSEFALL